MRSAKLWALAAVLVIVVAGSAIAETGDKPAAGKHKAAGHRRGRPGMRFMRGLGGKRGETLNITDEQRDKIKAIIKDNLGDLKGNFKDALGDKEKMAELGKQLKAAWEKAKPQILAVLTDEQKKKLEELKADAKKRFAEFREKHKGKGPGKFLDLTDDQKAAMKALVAQLREAHKAGDKDKIKKLRAGFADILTEEQRAKLKEMRAKRRGQHKGKRGKHGEKDE
ncbi:MAG: hypothetical protein QGD94_08665 [Planctomycetia bacterium]|nr:hypothetical protein [Planctomycetia bacterium]